MKVRWRTVVFSVLGFIALSLGVLYWSAANGFLAHPLTNWLSARLGRTVEVDGGLRIEIGRVTRLTAIGVRLANVPWGSRPDMLQARKLVVEVDTRSLFRDTAIIRNLVVEGLDLQLQRDDSGKNNWTFDLPPREPSSVLPVVIERAAVPGSKIRLAAPRLQRPLELELGAVEERLQPDGMLALEVHGLANATPLDLQLSAGPLPRLISARGLEVQGQGQLGEIALGIRGRVDSWEAPADTQAELSFRAPDAAYLATHLGLRNFGGGAVSLEIKIAPAGAISGLQGSASGQIGEFAVSAQGSWVNQAGIKTLAFKSEISGIDLSRIGGITGIDGLPAEPFHLQLEARHSGNITSLEKLDLALADGRVRINGTLGPGSKLPGSDLTFSATTPNISTILRRLKVDPSLTGPVEVTGKLLHTKPMESAIEINGTTTLGIFAVKGFVGRSPNLYGARLTFSVGGKNFSRLGRTLKLPDPPVGAYKGSGEIAWNPRGFALRGVSLSAADETLAVDGSLGRPLFAPGADLRWELSGNDASRMARRFGLSGLPLTRYHIGGRVQRQKGRTMLSGLKATVGSADLELDGILGDRGNLESTDLAFSVGGPALEDFSGLISASTWPHGKFRATGQLTVAADTLHLRNVQASLADAQGTVSADLALPLDAASMKFDIDANLPDLARLLPKMKIAAGTGKNLRVTASGSRLKDRWTLSHLRLESGTGLINTQGELDVAPRTRAKDVVLEFRLASLSQLDSFEARRWPDQPIAFNAKLSRTDTDLELHELTGRIGNSDFSGAITAHDLGRKPTFDIRLDFGKLDLDPFIKKAGPAPVVGSGPKRIAEPAQRLVIPADDLQLPNLNGYTGRMALKAQHLYFRDQDFKGLNLTATLSDGRLRVDPLMMTVAGATVEMNVDLTSRAKGFAAQIAGSAKNLRLSPFLTNAGGANASSFSAQVNLSAAGGSLRELAATLNGRLRLIGNSGRVANSGLIGGSNDFFRQLLVSLNPVATRQAMTDVVCVAYLIRAKDGILTTDPALVMRTAEVDIISNGTADLRTERIDVSFKTAARKGLGLGVAQLINPYIKVTGTLGKPGVALDPTGALVNGGAAFATAGLSIVATTVWDRVVHLKDPCAAAVADSGHSAQE